MSNLFKVPDDHLDLAGVVKLDDTDIDTICSHYLVIVGILPCQVLRQVDLVLVISKQILHSIKLSSQ